MPLAGRVLTLGTGTRVLGGTYVFVSNQIAPHNCTHNSSLIVYRYLGLARNRRWNGFSLWNLWVIYDTGSVNNAMHGNCLTTCRLIRLAWAVVRYASIQLATGGHREGDEFVFSHHPPWKARMAKIREGNRAPDIPLEGYW